MSKALALLALLCISGCYATDYFLSVYSSSSVDQDSFLFEDTVSSTCTVLGVDAAKYAVVSAGSGSGLYDVEFSDTVTSCATPDVTLTDIELDGAAADSNGFYYLLTTATVGLTDPTFYVATYSAAGCSDDDFVGEDEVDTCAAQTTDSTTYAELSYAFEAYTLTIGCSDNACSADCDATAEAAVVNDDTDCIVGTAAWYKVSTSTLDPDAASVLSFAAVALFALFALLF